MANSDSLDLQSKTEAELDILIQKYSPGHPLRKPIQEEKERRQTERDTAIQRTQETILSRTNIILWLTVATLLATCIGLVKVFFR